MAGEYWSRKKYDHGSLRKIRLVCRLIDGTSQKLHLLVHEIGHDAAWNYGRSTLHFHFFLINTLLNMQMLSCSRPWLRQVQHQAFLTPFPAE